MDQIYDSFIFVFRRIKLSRIRDLRDLKDGFWMIEFIELLHNWQITI
jgi:hypothetical protein